MQDAAAERSQLHAHAAEALGAVLRAIIAGTTDAYVALPFVASAAGTLGTQWHEAGAGGALAAVAYELTTLLPVTGRAISVAAALPGKLMFRATPLHIPTRADCAAHQRSASEPGRSPS